jgi:hypothetical protein
MKYLVCAFALISYVAAADGFPPYIGQPVGPGLASTSGGIYLSPALGTLATQNANAVVITGGTITGVTGINGSGAEQTISFQPGLLTAVTNTKGVFGKFVKASRVDNIIA